MINKQLIDTIKKLEIKLLQPDIRESPNVLDKLLSDDFIEVGSKGIRYTKKDILDSLPKQSGVRYSLSDFSAIQLSQNIVLATYSIEKIHIESRKKIYSFRSSVWRKYKSRWQIVFHQGTSIQYK